MTDMESRGIPTVFVASSEFIDAAVAQATALGSDPPRVFVPHPIQDRTDDEVRGLADEALEEILSKLVAAEGAAPA